jgi:flagellar motor switch protein FliG
MEKNALALIAALGLLPVWAGAAGVSSPDLGLLEEQNRIKKDSEEKIQRDVLDPILGKGKAMAFVDVEMHVKIERQQSNRSGMGLAERYKEKIGGDRSAGAQTINILPGVPKPKTITQGTAQGGLERPESVRAQQSQQVRGVDEEQFSITPDYKRIGVTVIHDTTVLKTDPQKKEMRSHIQAAMKQYQITDGQIDFRPVKFNQADIKPPNWKEDIQRPEVYLPLIFAGLLSILLAWLFGPLRKFFKQYVEAIREKPAAEVNVESTIEPPEDEGGGEGDNALEEDGKLDITLQNKPPEPPPEEDESMKKFEPFTYINETNLKRLVYMFMLRKEEPWVIAVVCSYLRPDFARMLITSLPVEIQAKVALEALTVRQVTREQVMAIDADVKENVDFVVGGMERLLAMLDEADTATRNNILNYLKNDKPQVYERVRKFVLTFEDIANFPDREMQTLVRELKAESMARALTNAQPEVVNKFFTNMSAGAASLLKEAMEYATGLTPSQIEEERGKIMDLIKVMEKEGKINVREKPGDGIDLADMDLSASSSREARLQAVRPAAPAAPAKAPADAAQAQQYFDAGSTYYNGGQPEQALQYFQHALSLNPDLWQAHQYMGNILYSLGRTAEALPHFEEMLKSNPDPQLKAWVESFKAQVGG